MLEDIRVITTRTTSLTSTTEAVLSLQQCQQDHQEQLHQPTHSDQTRELSHRQDTPEDNVLQQHHSTPDIQEETLLHHHLQDAQVGQILLWRDQDYLIIMRHKSISGKPPSDFTTSPHQLNPEDPVEPAPPDPAEQVHQSPGTMRAVSTRC